ncbi:ABC transporter, membrane protein [Syntrophotalea carbinolica DSM 2380]|uniref:ABC transporter, membrane protein n=1 Tax=Syntrophotalea carbinolica (strain DSM 2380 / NBRC 103641 / GraBd1) TaxID=338963 RepID=Q3A309_SYNC1|nr:iron export ABC transporter permease subunit FetB [Syntrophotalea carbinolica]ABA89248.1 ABC transporter, membrane protein [Syntrophotalea carbinolica DSM 2380]
MSLTGIVDPGPANMAFAYGMILMVAGLVRLGGAGREKALLWASLRMVVQLVVVGFLLRFIFAVQSLVPTLLILLVMGTFALQVTGGRITTRIPGFYRIIGIALALGCGGVTGYFCLFVVGPTPWYDPRYLIPLASMILGNSMNGASLAMERYLSEIRERRDEIETALCLGASASTAAAPVLRKAFRAALIPITNSMAAAGLVTLPGMMTGQILSGTDPFIAVKYQIAIMCAIVAGVAGTTFLVLYQCRHACFTSSHQLRDNLFPKV